MSGIPEMHKKRLACIKKEYMEVVSARRSYDSDGTGSNGRWSRYYGTGAMALGKD
jgi:hypothetical protein